MGIATHNTGVTIVFENEMLLFVADVDNSARVSSSSVSDDTKNSQPSQSATVKTNSSSQQQSNLPPRLQKKQRQAEEENYMKYYKPMDYMRKTNSYHRKAAAAAGATHQDVDSAVQNGSGSARRVSDVNSRGNVTNRTLWTDNLTSVTDGMENVSNDSSHRKVNYHQSSTGDARLSDSAACEQKPPVTVLTSSGSKLASVEAGIVSLNIQSTASSNATSQPSHDGPVSLLCVLWSVTDFDISQTGHQKFYRSLLCSTFCASTVCTLLFLSVFLSRL